MKRESFLTLVLFGIIGLYLSNKSHLACKREIIESYGLVSYDEGKKERLMLCPSIQFSCCPAFEQMKMFKNLQEKKPGFILLFEVIQALLLKLEEILTPIFKSGTITQKIQSLTDKPMQMRLTYAHNKIKGMRPKTIFKKLGKHHKQSSSYLAALKSSFYCVICDLQNHSFIDLKKKEIVYSAAFCDAFVQKTIVFAHLMNDVLVRLLLELLGIVARLKKGTKFQKLPGFKRLTKAIQDCVEDYKESDSGLGKCKSYCEYFSMLTDNYVYEGYPEFFANAIVLLKTIAPSDSSTNTPNTSSTSQNLRRRLFQRSLEKSASHQQNANRQLFESDQKQQELSDGQLNRMRILQEQLSPNSLQRAIGQHQQLERKRVLQDKKSKTKKGKNDDDNLFENDFFDPRNKMPIEIPIDDYDSSDHFFDENKVNQMVALHNVFFSGSTEEFEQKFRKIIADSPFVELDDIDSKATFKERSNKRYDLSLFQKKVGFAGANPDYSTNVMDFTISEIQIKKGLTIPGKDEVEIIFQEVIELANTINDQTIQSIHQNQLFRFNEASFRLYNDTVQSLIAEFALNYLRLDIAKNMVVYNYLVKGHKEDQAKATWSNIQVLNEQAKGLAIGSNKVSVNLFNKTEGNNRFNIELLIVSGQNATGHVNVTRITNINDILEDYESDTKKEKIDNVLFKPEPKKSETDSQSSPQQSNPPLERKLKSLTKKAKKARETILKKSQVKSEIDGVTHRKIKKEVPGKKLKKMK